VRENLEFFGGAYGLRGQALRTRVAATLAQFGLEPTAISGLLPGGYKQRLAMATGLLHEPDILFLDEPTSGIDPLARRAFWRTITALAQAGVTIIVTTHFMEEAEYCDRIAIQDAGKMLALGTPQAVREQAGGDGGTDMNSAFIAIVEQGRADGRRQEPGRPRMNHPEFMRRFIALLRKEVRQMLRDKSNLAVGLLLPIVLILLFGYGLSFDVKNAPVAVVLEDSAPDRARGARRVWRDRPTSHRCGRHT
jgi:ABC-type multidrug transport system ATPase subunit